MGQKYDTKAAFWDIHNNTKPGPERTAAYIKAIKEADESGDPYARMHMRANMAVFTPFYDDAVKILPVCAEFLQLQKSIQKLPVWMIFLQLQEKQQIFLL